MPRAIDFHVHPMTEEALAHGGPLLQQAAEYFHTPLRPVPLAETAALYRALDMRAVLLALDTESATGTPRVSNDLVADAVRQFPDVFIGFGSVDPWKGKLAVAEVERALGPLGLRGLKFHPPEQQFFPNDRRVYPIYEACAALGGIALFHTGTTGVGAGAPGGGGIHLKYSRPIPYLDDVAADFPSLTIVGAHPSWPWQEEMLAMAVHKANVYIDLSGWSPKYFPPALVHYANTLLRDKCLFGSDYPLIDPRRWLDDFARAPFRDEVRPKILLENASRILGLG